MARAGPPPPEYPPDHRVKIVVDPQFGERIVELARSCHLWVVDSPVNTPVIRRFWETEPSDAAGDPLQTGITSFTPRAGESPEAAVANHAEDIDLHHGVHSHDPAWSEIEVIGAPLSPVLRGVFDGIGTASFEETPQGFTCRRIVPWHASSRAAAEGIAVRRWGREGPEVVVLHGGPGAPGTAASLARALAPKFRVIEPLQRRSGDVPLTVARHVEDLALTAPPRAAIVGHSWGAMLALSFAAAHPERVRSLALVDCGTYDEVARAEFRRRTQERLGPEGRVKMAALTERLAQPLHPIERDRALAELGALHERAQGVDVVPDADDAALGIDAAGHEETWRDVLRLQAEGIEPRAFERIPAPVCMFHGADDPHPGPAIRDALQRHIPHLEYVEFPRCGHSPWLERAAREPFVAALHAWLSSAGRGP